MQDILLLGVSCMTGSMQIPPALRCAEMAKSFNVPVVFGGARASILPEQSAGHPLVDIAVKGEGEKTIIELVQYFQEKRVIETIK